MMPLNTGRSVVRMRRWFDGFRLHDLPTTMIVEDGTIVGIAPGWLSSDHAPVIDLQDRLVTPSLIDAHVHLFLTHPKASAEERKAAQALPTDCLLTKARAVLKATAEAGIGVVRDLGDNRGINLALRSDPAVRVLAAGPAVNRAGRYGSFLSVPPRDGDLEAAVATRVAAGVDLLKVIVSGAIDFTLGRVKGVPQFTPDEMQRLVTAAHAHGLPVATHASGESGIEVAIAAGVDTIEHGFFVTENQLKRMADSRIAWVPTLAPVWSQWRWAEECGWDAAVKANLEQILDDHRTAILRAHELGVTILAGSDAGSPMVEHGAGLLRELQLLQEAGLSLEVVLQATTSKAAERLDLGTNVGRLQLGVPDRLVTLTVTETELSAEPVKW